MAADLLISDRFSLSFKVGPAPVPASFAISLFEALRVECFEHWMGRSGQDFICQKFSANEADGGAGVAEGYEASRGRFQFIGRRLGQAVDDSGQPGSP
jgi:hypothetical protein